MKKGKIAMALDISYRTLLILMVIYNQQVDLKTTDTSSIIMYTVLVLYALAFSLLEKNRWIIIIESIVVILLSHYYHIEILYFILPLLAIKYLNLRTSIYDYIGFVLVTAGVMYYESQSIPMTIILAIGSASLVMTFYDRNKVMEYMENELKNERKTNSQYKSEIYEQKRELESAARMAEQSRRLTEIIKLDEIIERMLEASKWIFHADYVCLYVRDEKYYKLIRELGDSERYDVPQSLTLENGEKPVIEQRMMRVPIRYGKHHWGSIVIFNKRSEMGGKQKVPFPFEEGDYEILSIYISQAMLQLKNAKAMKEIRDLANNDGLTGIPNRRYFMQQAEYLIERARRGEDLTIFIMDVDNFKKFNDTYGHETGDEVLKIVAKTLKTSVRRVDLVSRYGGEEFAVVLPNAKEHSSVVAERIRKRIKSTPFVKTITISIGVAHYGSGGQSISEILNSADKALYHAKNTGKDKVVYYEEGM